MLHFNGSANKPIQQYVKNAEPAYKELGYN